MSLTFSSDISIKYAGSLPVAPGIPSYISSIVFFVYRTDASSFIANCTVFCTFEK
jgi:hypothetical protein